MLHVVRCVKFLSCVCRARLLLSWVISRKLNVNTITKTYMQLWSYRCSICNPATHRKLATYIKLFTKYLRLIWKRTMLHRFFQILLTSIKLGKGLANCWCLMVRNDQMTIDVTASTPFIRFNYEQWNKEINQTIYENNLLKNSTRQLCSWLQTNWQTLLSCVGTFKLVIPNCVK